MPILIYINLIGWIPFCLALFALLPRRLATMVGVVGAWLFLPPAGVTLKGIPDYTKASAFGYGIMLAMMIFAPERFARFRPTRIDLPIFLFCVGPFVTSLVNDLGPYDGLAAISSSMAYWGFPYLVGRLSFDDPKDVRALAVAIVVGGLVYSPLCLFENAVGPVLNSKVYAMILTMEARFGGWRPKVFLGGGLELAAWMAVCSLLGIWLWRSRSLKNVAGVPFGSVLLPLLIVTTVLTRSSGALALLGAALGVLWLSVRTERRIWMYGWLSLCFVYMAVRVPNLWDYSGFISFLQTNFDPDRAQSLEYRFLCEDILIRKALQAPIFGWGGWGRGGLDPDTGRSVVTDGIWIIFFGSQGFIGVLSFFMAFLAPAYAFVKKYPPRRWTEPEVGAMAAVVAAIGLYLFDCLLNGFANAVYMVAAGALASAVRAPAHATGSFEDFEADGAIGRPQESEPEPLGTEAMLAERYIEMARSLRLSGDYGGASAARRHALELLNLRSQAVPETPAARRRRLDCGNDLAWLLATRPDPDPGDHAEAVGLARAITEADPEHPTYWNTLALALCRAGDLMEAQEAARRSMELDEDWNGYDLSVLALADARLGRKDEAGRWLAEAVRWREQNAPADRTLAALIRETEEVLASSSGPPSQGRRRASTSSEGSPEGAR